MGSISGGPITLLTSATTAAAGNWVDVQFPSNAKSAMFTIQFKTGCKAVVGIHGRIFSSDSAAVLATVSDADGDVVTVELPAMAAYRADVVKIPTAGGGVTVRAM